MYGKWKGKEPPSSRVNAHLYSFSNVFSCLSTNQVSFLTTSPCKCLPHAWKLVKIKMVKKSFCLLLLPPGLPKTWVLMVGNNGDRHNTYPLTLSVVVPSWPNQGRLVEWRREGGEDVGIIVGAAEEEEDVAEEEEGQELLWASNLVFSLSSSAILCSRLSQSLMEPPWLPLHGHPGLYLHLSKTIFKKKTKIFRKK